MSWPPTLAELKVDADVVDERDDGPLAEQLAAAVAFVERVHGARFNFAADPVSELPDPDKALELGTLRLARRWFTRRKSPDALIGLGDLGAARVPSFDVDLDRMLRIGRFAPSEFA